jgi:DHA1 family bicyclomycin/chloramphenicol resistance-like MFS transporter
MKMPYNIPIKYIPAIMMFAVAVTVSGIDIYIPSLPFMQKYFQTSEELMQFSISASIIGSSIVTIFLGQLADASGRRKILLIFQSLYALISFLIIFSPNIETFITLRFLTGITSTGGFTLAFVVIGDLFGEKKASNYYAYLTASILLALILAPFFGGIFASMNRWDYSFLFLSVVSAISTVSIWMFLPETLEKKRPFSFRAIWKKNTSIVFRSTFYDYTIMHSVLLGGTLSFFANASFYYIDKLGLSPGSYAKHQVTLAIVNLISSLVTPKLFGYFGISKTLRIALFLAAIGSMLFLLFSITYPTIAILLSFAASIFIFGASMSFISCFSIIMNSFPEERAAASSMVVLLRGILLALSISIGSFLYHGTALQIGYTLIFFVIVSLLSYLHQMRQNKDG